MKLEFLELTAPELLDLLSAMNYFDVSKLLAEAVYMHTEKNSDSPANFKNLANEFASYNESLIFASDLVIDSLKDAEFIGGLLPEQSEIDILADILDCQADDKINEFREQNYFNTL